jgi:dihydropteroate synthase
LNIMGVLNLTPDSFSDGGQLLRSDETPDRDRLIDRAAELVRCGATVLDLGGESTRPGAEEITATREARRVVPAIEALAKRFELPLAIDTRRASVAAAALDAGASVINDVSGLRHDPELASVARRAECTILGHLRGEPATMQDAISFTDVVAEVTQELLASAELAQRAGIAEARLCFDPGIGFGKTAEQNFALLANLGTLRAALPGDAALLIGVSRKAFLGHLTGDRVTERDLASHVAGAIALFAGADALRVHDAAGARRAAQVALALRAARKPAR